MAARLGWSGAVVVVRPHGSGASLAFSAPEDQLYAATEVNEWAWLAVCCEAGLENLEIPCMPGHPDPRNAAQAEPTLRRLAAAEAQPELMALLGEAQRRGLSALLDDELISLGAGRWNRAWPRESIPTLDTIPWPQLKDIPTALVTGSNGKTTSVRLVSAMVAAMGWTPGHTCTDGIFVGAEWLEAGDYSGPVGARRVLRHPQVEAAVLETARGGILRRGLPMRQARAALITNISPDHFGEYGIHSLESLADVKLVVARALGTVGTLVLNADDPVLAAKKPELSCPLAWFAMDDAHPLLEAHRAAGGATCAPRKGRLRLHMNGDDFDLGAIEAMPLSAGGAAFYNVANAAGAALLAAAMGVDGARITSVLGRFGASHQDNPGRLDRWDVGGARILMDYAHNPEGLQGLLAVAARLRSGRMGLLLGQAGNRDDGDIRALAAVAAEARPDFVVLKDLEGYMRGREVGEVPAILGDELQRRGVPEGSMRTVLPEVEAAKALLAWARPGDVIVLPVHGLAARKELTAYLDRGFASIT